MLDTHRAQLAEDDPGSLMMRSEILDSWRRSKLSGVDPDHVRSVAHEARLDSRIAKIAIPVLDTAADALVGAHTSLLLSAPDGTLLWRWDGDGHLKKRLDRSNVHLGTVMSEDIVGTNGLGTALETARSVTVSGTEHFSEMFHDFTCAGAPVRHPVTNRVTGVLSLTTLVKDASPLMAPTLLRLAQDIEEELYGESTMHERQMLRHFLAERRRARSAVVAVSADVVIANAIATAMDLDHTALWERIEGSPEEIIGLELAAGSHVTVCRPVSRGGQVVGAVVVAEDTAIAAAAGQRAARARGRTSSRPAPRERPWARLVAQLRDVAESTDRLLVAGEDGVGKRAALRATLTESNRGYREIDCAAVDEVGREEWLHQVRALMDDPDGLVVLAHLDALDARDARALASILESSDRPTSTGLHLAGTVSTAAYSEHTIPRALTDQFAPDAFEVEPLRKRPDDVLARLVDQGVGMPTLSREAVQMAQRHPWPGNHRQLEQFRRWMARQDRPVLVPDDLPASWRNELTRGNLTSMQMAESDAIVAALRQAAGNKAAAATALGISRSSLYRKMREYHLR
ncbi:Transcriptional regulator of acetoin/glycerol metabolism [Nocardioides sp. YR527]|uniref:sigma-54-dependent Fis family transcriptional regulator n=1 Tax=Nocardioides sp. YR527 TaxID=1881028 RepID=UPI000888364F|nr:helix-turn-helix domain-containing protein [Nocardioides sp. YR527]SDL38616.1 Transcriptional regulator of acetoin/glycerol metabolism [Nocardioides sp. YR527]